MDVLQSLPALVDETTKNLPPWVIGVFILSITAVVTISAHGMIFRLLQRVLHRRVGELGQKLLERFFRPSRIGLLILTLSAALPVTPIYGQADRLMTWGLLLGFIIFVGWSAGIVVNTTAELSTRRARSRDEDPLLFRRHTTQIELLRRAVLFLVYFITISALLMTVPAVRQFGVSLFASAGVAGLVLGLAARPVISNFIAGIQIAITQPVRIGDEVIMEGEYGTVEEIRATYVVLRTWDWRRLVLPLSTVIEKSFQNWTLTATSQIGTVFWIVDIATPIEPVRQKFIELVKQSKLWDGQVAGLQVTDVTREGMQIRGIASAATAGAAFDLRCEIREKLLRWMRDEYPQALPYTRQFSLREDIGAAEPGPEVRGSPGGPHA